MLADTLSTNSILPNYAKSTDLVDYYFEPCWLFMLTCKPRHAIKHAYQPTDETVAPKHGDERDKGMASIEYLRHFARFGDNRVEPLLMGIIERANSSNAPSIIRGLSRSLKYIGSSAISKFDTRQEKTAVFQSEGFESELS